jgi:hypothetical protein
LVGTDLVHLAHFGIQVGIKWAVQVANHQVAARGVVPVLEPNVNEIVTEPARPQRAVPRGGAQGHGGKSIRNEYGDSDDEVDKFVDTVSASLCSMVHRLGTEILLKHNTTVDLVLASFETQEKDGSKQKVLLQMGGYEKFNSWHFVCAKDLYGEVRSLVKPFQVPDKVPAGELKGLVFDDQLAFNERLGGAFKNEDGEKASLQHVLEKRKFWEIICSMTWFLELDLRREF